MHGTVGNRGGENDDTSGLYCVAFSPTKSNVIGVTSINKKACAPPLNAGHVWLAGEWRGQF